MATSILSEAQSKVKVGNSVIWQKGSQAPRTTNVIKVTPKGWIRVHIPVYNGPGYEATFKPSLYHSNKYEEIGVGKWNSPGYLYIYSDEAWNQLNKIYEDNEVTKKEKEESKKKEKEERDLRYQNEINEVKKLCGNIFPIATGSMELLDGSKLVFLNVPIKETCKERKQNFEIAICRLKKEEDYNYETNTKELKVSLYLTYCNGHNSSFPSCSGAKFNTDNEALWEAIRYCYNDSW